MGLLLMVERMRWLVLAAFLPCAMAVQDFPGYMMLPGQNISSSANDVHPSLANQACIQSGFPESARHELAKLICDSNLDCQFFNEVAFKHWKPDPNVVSYISMTKCGNANYTGHNYTDGGCDPIGGKTINSTYFQCLNEPTWPLGLDGDYHPIATYLLPPFLIALSCDGNPLCIAFSVDIGGTFGTLYKADFLPSVGYGTYNLKISATDASSVADVAVTFEHTANLAQQFAMFEGLDIGGTLTMTDVLTPCEPGVVPQYNASYMTLSAQIWACANSQIWQGPLTCDTFIDQPRPNEWGQMVWSHFKFFQNANKTSYVSADACKPIQLKCGARMLKCSGLNTTAAPVVHETYDLPLDLIRQACIDKGCHAFTVLNDNSAGTLFTFPAVASSSSSYLLLQYQE